MSNHGAPTLLTGTLDKICVWSDEQVCEFYFFHKTYFNHGNLTNVWSLILVNYKSQSVMLSYSNWRNKVDEGSAFTHVYQTFVPTDVLYHPCYSQNDSSFRMLISKHYPITL